MLSNKYIKNKTIKIWGATSQLSKLSIGMKNKNQCDPNEKNKKKTRTKNKIVHVDESEAILGWLLS
jgi:hypothetical protein